MPDGVVDEDNHIHPAQNSDGIYENTIYYACFEEDSNVTIKYEVILDSGHDLTAIPGSLIRNEESVKPATGTLLGSAVNTIVDGYEFVGWTKDDSTQVLSIDKTYKPTKLTSEA